MSNDNRPIDVTKAAYDWIGSLACELGITCAEVIDELISSYIEMCSNE